MTDYDGNYFWLSTDPPTPSSWTPSLEECINYEFIQMSQLCRIDPKTIGGKMRACEAFGGDRGRNKVQSERQVRAVIHGKSVRKYVLTVAVIDYLKEVGIINW